MSGNPTHTITAPVFTAAEEARIREIAREEVAVWAEEQRKAAYERWRKWDLEDGTYDEYRARVRGGASETPPSPGLHP